ncbi:MULTISPECIES: branched-chain amino acid ABC transporter permease [Paraburkholderia]|uniref:Branched-chain amino acid ABC transporter permease n=1 Tax=Paraburkholderia youngii TaxID=2782701 RepID=A0A7W8L9T1_9BURK|nr:branched-chain amino acid ABC transporter permease [Paraburkholderia youngii]MBB5403115.1 branched-chain amino acid transport system permease protein [Paraburkholderia youngii]NUX54495.1 branched-chain amino acid ABC transporter permease [Paraburkholderia youngii]NVI04264.1 branched-chain amino acid ABC transporter permease [Paraburkholderia youngii]
MSDFFQFVIEGLTTGSFYALVALGYTMVYGIIRLINFAHGDLFMVGAFIGWTGLMVLASAHLPLAVALLIALAAAMTVTGALGLLIERLAYQPLLRAPRLSILITALGVSLALQNGVLLIYGAGFRTYPHVLSQAGFELHGVQITFAQIGIIVASLALMLALYFFVHHTFLGTAMRALAIDQDAARLMGIDVERLIQLTFLLGSVLAAVAGVMEGLYYTQINFFMGFVLGLRAFTAAVLGGIGNIPGAMAGGILIGLLEAFGAGYVSSQWTDVFVFGVLIAVLVIKPTGLFGERVVERM